jgi:hypothetical protein
MDDPELVTLIPEEEPEEKPPVEELGRKLVIQIVAVVCLKVATGLAIRSLVKTIREIDVLYPESLNKVNWKDNL